MFTEPVKLILIPASIDDKNIPWDEWDLGLEVTSIPPIDMIFGLELEEYSESKELGIEAGYYQAVRYELSSQYNDTSGKERIVRTLFAFVIVKESEPYRGQLD